MGRFQAWRERRAQAQAGQEAKAQQAPAQTPASAGPAAAPAPRDGGAGFTLTSPYGRRPAWMRVGNLKVNLYEGREDLELVGESNYQDALWQLVGGRRGDRVREPVVAMLVAESGNPYDAEAVSAWISGLLVGYVPRRDAGPVRAALLDLQRQHGGPIALRGVITGGGPRPGGVGHLGVWLHWDPADFGLAAPTPAPPVQPRGGLRSRRTHAVAADEDDDSYDLGWMDSLPDDPVRRIPRLRQLLDAETAPLSRHYLLSDLESCLYGCRGLSPTLLTDYDAVARQHDGEMSTIRPALLGQFGDLPRLETYRQSAIRHQKAGDHRQSLWWAQRGLEVYGNDAHKPEWVADLAKRVAAAQIRIDREAAAAARSRPEPVAAVSGALTSQDSQVAGTVTMTEDLICVECGQTFTRTRTPGRKPQRCPDCR